MHELQCSLSSRPGDQGELRNCKLLLVSAAAVEQSWQVRWQLTTGPAVRICCHASANPPLTGTPIICLHSAAVVQERQVFVHRVALRAKLQAATQAFLAERGQDHEDNGGSLDATMRRVAAHFSNEAKCVPPACLDGQGPTTFTLLVCLYGWLHLPALVFQCFM